MSEADRVNNKVVGTAVFVTSLLLVVMVAGIYRLFDVTVRAEIDRKVNSVESTQLRRLRVEEQRKLNGYQWVDQKNGVVRVPVDRAVELITSEGYQRPIPVAPPPAPAAALPGDGGHP